MEIAEIACCDADHVGVWHGEWEPCIILVENKQNNCVQVRCLSDQSIVIAPVHLVRKLKNNWLCQTCTYLNVRADKQCCMCTTTPTTGARSTTPVTHKHKQQQVVQQFQQQVEQTIHSSLTMYEVAACDSTHVGRWNGLWEECKLIKRDPSGLFCDVEIMCDREICQNIKSEFIRQKFVIPLVGRTWL